MHIAEYKEFVAVISVTANVLQFLSGIIVCKQYVDKKSTGEATALPFIFGTISCYLWLLYGVTKPDRVIVYVNIFGVMLMFLYLILFYTVTLKKSTVLRQIIFTICTIAFITVYYCSEDDYEVLLNRSGLSACSITLLMIAAPLSKLYHVIQTKSSECLPFPMILMSFFVSLFWFLYGVIEVDIYITVPNFIGGILATIQLPLFIIYPVKTYSRLSTKSILA